MRKTIFAALLTVAVPALSADGTITFHGEIFEPVCTIHVGDASHFTVNLDRSRVAQPAGVGSRHGDNTFDVTFSNCPQDTHARTFFQAGPNVDAANVHIVLKTKDGTDIVIGPHAVAHGAAFEPAADGSYRLAYRVEYVATGPATVGAVSSSVIYTIEYE